MSEEISLLCESLSKQLDMYKQVLELSKEETNCLLHNDVKGLNELMRKKEASFMFIQKQEEIRKRCIRSLAQMFNMPGVMPKISQLKDLIHDENTIELVKIQKELGVVAKELTLINQRNALLVENVLNYTTDMMKLYMGVNKKVSHYNRKGALETVGSRACDRRV